MRLGRCSRRRCRTKLAANGESSRSTRAYADRGTFRDLKIPALGLRTPLWRSNTAERFEILLLLGTLATLAAWLSVLQALAAVELAAADQATPKRQVLPTFFIGRQILKSLRI